MTQLAFPIYGQPAPEKADKHVRETSATQYRQLVDSGTLAKRRESVLLAIERLRQACGLWPTACELLADMMAHRDIPNDGNPNHVKPRLTELAETGAIVRGPKRKSLVSGLTVLTWQIRSR